MKQPSNVPGDEQLSKDLRSQPETNSVITPRNISESSKHEFVLLYNSNRVALAIALPVKNVVNVPICRGAVAKLPLRILSD